MEITRALPDDVWSFWTWIAGDFWPALAILILGFIYTELRACLDRGEVANRMQRQEYMDWKKRYLSGELTASIPPDPGADPNLRWFVVRKNKKPKKVIISNRGDSPAYNVRVRLAESTRKASWRWRVGAGRSMRAKIGKVSDKNWNGVALDIHWDDKKLLAQKVTFMVPQSEFELPTPALPSTSDRNVPRESARNEESAVKAPSNKLPLAGAISTSPAPVSSAQGQPPLLQLGTSPRISPSTNGMHSSTNIADRRIPNRTPGFPADFVIIPSDDQLLLMNRGPGDASHIYLQPLDDDQLIVGNSFWLSIPAGRNEPFLIDDTRRIGNDTLFFKVSWDDGFQLKRHTKLEHKPITGG